MFFRKIALLRKLMPSSSPVPASNDSVSSLAVPDDPKPFPGTLDTLPQAGAIACGRMDDVPEHHVSISSDTSNHRELLQVADKLQRDLHYLESSLDKLCFVEDYAVTQFRIMEQLSRGLQKILYSDPPPSDSQVGQVMNQLCSLERLVSHLKHQMPSLHFLPPRLVSRETGIWAGGSYPYHFLREQHCKDVKVKVMNNVDFNGFMKVFQEPPYLDENFKKCLLFFSAFPAKAVVKKRLLKYWWIGEGLIETDPKQTTADEVLKKLMEKGFIELVLKKRRLVGFRVNPLVRFVIISLAEKDEFFAFDGMGVPEEGFSSNRAFLVGSDGNSKRPIYGSSQRSDSVLEKAITIFNINDSHPQLRKKWFSKLKGLKVLHLSGWPGSANRLVEIENTEFLRGIEDMKDLKLLSLQGVSGIVELPDSISELTNLEILDLQACHNLDKLPQKLHKLGKLTHLDISGCYWLDHMPKEVAKLSELKVLKGFVVGQTSHGDTCKLTELENLKKLRKLFINAKGEYFPGEEDLKGLRSFKKLEKLKILWWNSSYGDPAETNKSDTGGLKKLEMEAFPGKELPRWATKGELMPKDKLNIRGGNLYKLSEMPLLRILSVKFLGELTMDWTELTKSFPKLVYLEKVRCPKLRFFPCDDEGVWINEQGNLEDLGLTWSFLAQSSDM